MDINQLKKILERWINETDYKIAECGDQGDTERQEYYRGYRDALKDVLEMLE